MGVVKNIMVLEDKLEAIFSYLPAIDTFIPKFAYGDPKELAAFLKHKHKGQQPYPLIWLLYPYAETHEGTHLEATNVSLILAVQTNASMQNKQRLAETYKKILFPLYDNIVYAFNAANIVNVAHKYRVVKHPNYSDDRSLGGSHAGPFIWDAMKVTFDIKIQDTCLRPIIF